MAVNQLNEAELSKRRAAALSLSFNLLQSVIKIIAAVITGSVSVLSEAVHSSTDIVASVLAYIGVRIAAAPPDDEHPYGHGKVESLTGFAESILLFGIVVYICIHAVDHLIHPPVTGDPRVGIIVMAISAAGCLGVSRYMVAVAKRTNSLALKSNGQHLTADFVTSLGVLVALAATQLTGWSWVDPVMAIVIALWMAYGAVHLAGEAFHHLIDRRLSDEELDHIEAILLAHPEVLGHHRLRSRLSGNMRYIDMHIVVPNDWTLIQAHHVADELEKQIAHELTPAQVVIHVDPYDAGKAAPPSTQRRDLRAPAPDTER